MTKLEPTRELQRGRAPATAPVGRRAASRRPPPYGIHLADHPGRAPPFVQCRRAIGAVDDPLEREAERAADRAMSMPALPAVQRRAAPGAPAPARAPLPATLGAGQPLDAALRELFEPRFDFDFRQVRLHTGAKASDSARRMGALAYTMGQDIVFGAGQLDPSSTRGRHLLAHELAHVVQQSAGAASPGGGSGAAAELTQVPAPALALQRAPGHSPLAARVLEALSRRDPVAGVGSPSEALSILRGVADADELLSALIELDEAFQIDLLVQAIGPDDRTLLGAAIHAVRFTSAHGQPGDQFAVRAARGIAALPEGEQDALIARVLQRRGLGTTVEQVREGVQALLESESQLTAEGEEEVEDLSSPAPLMAGVAMGPWNPGRMPIPFYLGNAAHLAIAAEYAALHGADLAFYNFSPLSTILETVRAMGVAANPLALRAAQLGLKPDIANITRRHLYEIKPVRLQALGATEARLYQAAFAAAGLVMALGPRTEPGTAGTIPAPGGWYTFSAPEPGVITYRYRQPRRRRLRARRGRPVVDKSFMDRMAEITGLTGVALVIYIIISEGSRVVVPPRNLIPVP